MTQASLRFMLLQVRNADDPMRQQEADCFAEALCCDPPQLDRWICSATVRLGAQCVATMRCLLAVVATTRL